LLEQIETDVIKVASGEINNPYLFDAICETNVPVLVSSGMSYLAELDTVVAVLRKAQLDFALMQCTSMYPTPAEKVGIQILDQFRERYDCPVGLSDHSGTIFPSLIAAYLGAKAIEVHVAFSRQDTGPDVSSSLTFDELSDMIAGVRFVEALRTSPVDKDAMADELHAMRQLFTKSVVAKTALPKGTVLSSDVLTVKKPGFGIPAARLSTLVGRQTTRALKADTLISEEDLEPTPAEDDAIQ
jgi:N-acetylneuraminate synthase